MGVMRKRIKPIVVYVVLALLGLALVIAKMQNRVFINSVKNIKVTDFQKAFVVLT